eukprot:CAMPEP_0201184966 /NCGR_PEP_ID=MMETSP0851-20130426/127554_1 /ASSEMBLY_ACC=CAM_ASM_000631 /TAXON_ID=183588 /ORGANISM="Pseudo-nitzschia fraudulenta, Strain WWA7" /LENGTH=30 /DNA_ID= /DNA_START= /DNA_END= /DNA_ORIENTATION=
MDNREQAETIVGVVVVAAYDHKDEDENPPR